MARFQAIHATDWMALADVEIEGIGNTLIITGKNCVGKSSLCRALDCLIFGSAAAPDVPIRVGQDHAILEGDVVCGDATFHVARKIYRRKDKAGELTGEIGWTAKITQKLANDVVAEISSPQTTIERLFGGRGARVTDFATLGLTAAGRREQIETLKRMAGIDTTLVDAKIADARTERLDAGREVKRLTAQSEALPTPPEGTPAELVDIAGVSAMLQEQHDANRKREAALADATRAAEEAEQAYNKIAELKRDEGAKHLAKIVELNDAITAENARHHDAVKGLNLATLNHQKIAEARANELATAEALPQYDTAPLTERLATAETTNIHVRQAHAIAALATELEAACGTLVDAEDAVDALVATRAETLAAANLGIEGLRIDEDEGCVCLGDVPIAQASESEALLVACRIFHAANNEGVLFLNGNGLDDKSLAAVVLWAGETGVQIVIERLSSEGGLEIVATDDGSVLAEQQEG